MTTCNTKVAADRCIEFRIGIHLTAPKCFRV
jgi:hypothetical protein